MSLENKFRQNEIKPLQPKQDAKDPSRLEKARNKNRLLLPLNETSSTQEDRKDSLKRKADEEILEDIERLKRFKKGIGVSEDKENVDPSKSQFKQDDQGKEYDDSALDDTITKRRNRTPFAPKENLQQRDTGQNGAPHSREIGPDGLEDTAQQNERLERIIKDLKITPDELQKFEELHRQIGELDPKYMKDAVQQSEQIQRIIKDLDVTPEEFQKFNRLLDAIPPDEQGHQTNSESSKVKDNRKPQTDKVDQEKTFNEIPKVTQADIDKLAKKIESSKRNWEMLMEALIAMQTPGIGY